MNDLYLEVNMHLICWHGNHIIFHVWNKSQSSKVLGRWLDFMSFLILLVNKTQNSTPKGNLSEYGHPFNFCPFSPELYYLCAAIVFYGGASSNSITPDWFFPPNWTFLQKAHQAFAIIFIWLVMIVENFLKVVDKWKSLFILFQNDASQMFLLFVIYQIFSWMLP